MKNIIRRLLANRLVFNAFFDDYIKKTDTAKDVIKLSLERLEINLLMRSSG